MKSKLYALSLLFSIVLLPAPVLAGLPDLSITGSDILFSVDNPEPGEPVTITATVHNNGDDYFITPPFASHEADEGQTDFVSISSGVTLAQHLFADSNMYIGKVSLCIKNSGTTSDAMTVQILKNRGTGVSGPSATNVPSNIIASKTVVSTFTSFGWQDFIFDTAPFLTAYTTYWICITNPLPDAEKDNAYQLKLDSAAAISLSTQMRYSSDHGENWWLLGGENYAAFFKAYKCTDTIVGCYEGDPDSGGVLIGSQTFHTPIPAGTSAILSFPWTALASTRIYVTADRPGNITESLENNNSAYEQIDVVATPPCISGTVSPAEGTATVGVTTPVSVTFSEDMNPALTQQSLSVKALRDAVGAVPSDTVVTGTVTYAARTLTMSTVWKKGYTYQVTVSTDAQDLYGNPLAASKVWSFSTPPLPAVTGQVLPPENATNVAVTAPLKITFTDDMDPALTKQSLSVKALRDATGAVPAEGTITGAIDYSSKTLTMSTVWKKGYTYQVTISSGAQDTYGNPLAAAKIWSFSTASLPAITGQCLPPANRANVDAAAPLQISFSDAMDPVSLQQALSVTMVRDNKSLPVSETVTGTFTYTSPDLTFTTAWRKGCTYHVRFSTAAHDLFGNPVAAPAEWEFSTIRDREAENRVVDEASGIEVTLAPGAVAEDYYVTITPSPIAEPALSGKIQQATAKIRRTNGDFFSPLAGSITEFSLFTSAGAPLAGNFPQGALLRLPYTVSNGFVRDSDGRLVREKTLSLYWLDETSNLWLKLPDSAVDTQTHTVAARVNHFSVYALFGGSDTDLSHAYAYPVPWKPSAGNPENGTLADGITFTGLGSEATIRLYTLSGELVKVLRYQYSGGSEQQKWDGTNEQGEAVASGVYLYRIENSREHVTGKLIIVR